MQVSSAIICCIGDSMIISQTEEQSGTDLNTMMYMVNWNCLKQPAKVQGPTQMAKFLGITWAGATQHIPQVTKK